MSELFESPPAMPANPHVPRNLSTAIPHSVHRKTTEPHTCIHKCVDVCVRRFCDTVNERGVPGATNTGDDGPRTRENAAIVTLRRPMRSVPSAPESAPDQLMELPAAAELWPRIRLAQSILAHRDLVPSTRRDALAALAGFSVEDIAAKRYPGGDA